MPPDERTPRVPQGPIGGYVIAGLRQRRKELDLTYKDLAARLERIGRPIPTLGLSRIERGERRVDADDLVALAIALDVFPASLLMPQDAEDDAEPVALTGEVSAPYVAVRQWFTGQAALPDIDAVDWPRAMLTWRTSPSELAQLRRRIERLEAERVAPEPNIILAIVTSRRGVLIGRRHDGKPPWTFIAGEQEPGEQPEDTAIREVKEEACLDVRVGHVIGSRVHPATHRRMFYLAAKPAHGTTIAVGDEAELAEVRWASLREALELMPDMYSPVRDYIASEGGQ
jgi:8-oxo-dGTP pyrophosphatase MutT (NUDIX family)